MLCNHLEGWDKEGRREMQEGGDKEGRREMQEGGDMGIYICI